MRTKSAYLIVLIFGLTTSPLWAQDSTKVLTLDDCVKAGIDSSTQILLAKDSLALTGTGLIRAYGQFLPDLAFNGIYNYNAGNNLLVTEVPTLINSRANLLNYQLSSTINIFNGLSDYSGLKQATLSKSATQFSFERAKQQIAFDVTQSYLQVVLDRYIVAYAQKNLIASVERESQLKALTDVGRRTLSDYYQQVAQTSSDSLYLIQSQDKLKNDIIGLFRRIRITETDKYSLADLAPDTVPLSSDYQSLQDLIDKATRQRPDVKSAETYVDIGTWNIKQNRSGYLPKLYFEAGLVSNGGYLNSLSIDGVPSLGPQEPLGQALFGQVYGALALNLTWHIFDRLVTKTNIDIAKIYRHNAEIIRDDLKVQISSDVKQAYNDYLSAFRQSESASRGLTAAQQAFELVQGRYNVGSATFIEVSNAQITLLQAEVNKAQANVNIALQKKIIDFYLGN